MQAGEFIDVFRMPVDGLYDRLQVGRTHMALLRLQHHLLCSTPDIPECRL